MHQKNNCERKQYRAHWHPGRRLTLAVRSSRLQRHVRHPRCPPALVRTTPAAAWLLGRWLAGWLISWLIGWLIGWLVAWWLAG